MKMNATTDHPTVSNRRHRLARLIAERYENQADFVAKSGQSQSEVSGLLKSKSFGEKKARSIEVQCGLPVGWLDLPDDPLSGRGAALVGTDHSGDNRRAGVDRRDEKRSNVSAHDSEDDLSDEFVYVPESKIEFAAGNGRTAIYELIEDEEPATYRRAWFQKYGINPNRVRRFRVSGDSMEPMLYARDTILVNQDETNIVDGKLYAIRYGDELRVKYLSRRLDGTLILHSVNQFYKDEEVPPALVAQHITVIGRVRDASGTGGL